ncbi:hypothetical protein HHL16_12590 [Pseudoflavitalea sp. G-6-1-2]|uniref:hypothetical protein n=1 Tax=Pseudoflavitalea sp. G-6-1-2 TaxID=2728841 RepID=UPI00146A3C23|nr:hypothetical protein [Pseudoflavitalea sp. G-6-1-2]NML21720.1 hypothetical protein [Pseudoflavitalea sp. G-6-1-2]
MRPYSLTILLATCLFTFAGCKKDADPNIPVITLSTEEISGKSDNVIEVTVDMTIPDGWKSLEISKGVNLKPDANFKPVLPSIADLGENKYRYIFYYTLQQNEIDKLVGFNFKLTDKKERVVEKDLTVNTVANPAEIIYKRKWLLKSILRETASPAEETIKPCEKDNVFTWKKDSTINLYYGTSACDFDGLNVYDKWRLEDNDKTFVQEYYALFNPSSRTVEKYNVRSITNDKLVMDIVLDLSWLGPPYTDKEKFVYTFESTL